MEEAIKSILSRKDPQGFYVIVAESKAKELIPDELRDKLVIEEIGDRIIVRTKSRSLAEKISRMLLRKGLLRFDL